MTARLPEPTAGAGDRRPGMGLGRPAVVLSIVFHVVGFFVIVGVPRLLASGPDRGKVYIVDLVTLPGPSGPAPATPAPPAAAAPAPQPAPPKPAVAQKPPPVKPPKEKAIVLPEKTAKKPPVKPQPVKPKEQVPVKETAADTPEPATTTPTTTAPTAPAAASPSVNNPAGTSTIAGTGGGGEGAGTGGGGDAYTFYLALLKQNIERAWKRPVYTGDSTLSATVNLKLSRAGRVQRLELSHPSGFEPLDRSLMVAVRAAEPFPPFPAALAMETLAVQIVFDLTPEGSEP